MAESLLNTEFLRSEIKRQFGTQSAFARHMGWSRQYLSQVLNGKVNVTLAQLAEISNALDAPASKAVLERNSSLLRESTSTYLTDNLEEALVSGPTILVANQTPNTIPLIDISSLRRWSSGDPAVKRFGSPQERVTFIRSIQEYYRDRLPSTEVIHQYKQEEKELEERQYASRA